jgi:hypothetical protein
VCPEDGILQLYSLFPLTMWALTIGQLASLPFIKLRLASDIVQSSRYLLPLANTWVLGPESPGTHDRRVRYI